MRRYFRKLVVGAVLLSIAPFGVFGVDVFSAVAVNPAGCIVERTRTDDDHRDGLELDIRRLSGENSRIAGGTRQIESSNIDALFTHEYEPGKFGAKGLSYIDAAGKFNLFFWKTGFKGDGNNIHHRDALSHLMSEEASRLMDTSAMSNSPHEIKVAADKFMFYLEQSEHVTRERRHESIPVEILKRTQGYQLTATEIQGKLKVTTLEVGSSITKAQRERGMKLNMRQLAIMISQIYNSIAPEVRAIKRIEIRDLEFGSLNLSELQKLLAEEGISQSVAVTVPKSSSSSLK